MAVTPPKPNTATPVTFGEVHRQILLNPRQKISITGLPSHLAPVRSAAAGTRPVPAPQSTLALAVLRNAMENEIRQLQIAYPNLDDRTFLDEAMRPIFFETFYGAILAASQKGKFK